MPSRCPRLLPWLLLLLLAPCADLLAACFPEPGVLATRSIQGRRSYVWNPGNGFTPQYSAPYVYDYVAPVSGDLIGDFWALGSGDPAPGSGDDSNNLLVSDWLSFYGPGIYGSYFPAEIFGSWAQTAAIDGCILDNPTGCTCILLLDHNDDDSQFALLGAQANVVGDTSYTQPGFDGAGNNGPIIFASLPVPAIVTSTRHPLDGSLDLVIDAGPPFTSSSAGVYIKNGCGCEADAQYRLVTMELERGAPPPTDRDASLWTPVGDFTPFGGTMMVNVACDSFDDVDLYLATQVAFDPASGGGYGLDFVSANSTRISCGLNPTLAEPTPFGRGKARPRQGKRSRSTP